MKLSRSYVLAILIAALITAWIASGVLFDGPAGEDAPSVAESDAMNAADDLLKVRAARFVAESRVSHITVRGRTEAVRKVQVRSETNGTVVAVPVEEGSVVKEGDVLCELSLNARDARMAEAEAVMRQRWLEYDAAEKLAAKGHRSQTQVAAARAAYDAARANVKQMEVELANTKVRAPYNGILETRHVEIGDYMQAGSPCATVVDMNPFLVVGQVSETDVSKIEPGTVGTAKLVSGQTVEGIIRYIGKTADEATRTFRVEMEIPNDELTLRDGVTTEMVIPSHAIEAHRIPPAILTLNDQGDVGVRTVDAESRVHFTPVRVLEDTREGVWVAGLPKEITIITVGQDFVTEGQTVDVTIEKPEGMAS